MSREQLRKGELVAQILSLWGTYLKGTAEEGRACDR